MPCRVQLPPLPLVCSADASAAFASISSLYIGIPRVPADSRTLFSLSAFQSARSLQLWEKASVNICPEVAVMHKRTVVCHLLSGSALPNHSDCVSTDEGLWCNILLHRQSLCAQAWNRWCSVMRLRCMWFLWGATDDCVSWQFFFWSSSMHQDVAGVMLGRFNTALHPSLYAPTSNAAERFRCSIEYRAGVWCSTQHLSALPTALCHA